MKRRDFIALLGSATVASGDCDTAVYFIGRP
jgi:hypothetical protein